MSKGQCGQVTDQEKLDRSVFSKDHTVIELDPLLIQLLKLHDIKTFIEKLCEKQDLKVTWTLSELNSTITCYCKDKKAVQDFRDVLYHNLEKKTYSVCYGSEKSAFSECIKEYTGKCLVSTHGEDNFHIFTTRNIGEKLAGLEVTVKDTKIDIQKKFTTKQNVAAWQLGNGSFNQQTFGEEHLRKSTKADKLGTTVKHGDLDDCVICMEPPTLPRKLHCDQGVVTGDQPPGTMKVRTSVLSLPGHHHCGRIEIEYVIHPGKQAAEHPNEGQWYEGIEKHAYLPDTKDGRKIAKLLGVAFDRKLIFTIGHSRTTGKQGVVKWNDIHHKTNPNPGTQFGYPDDTYFDRVLDELRIKGVTEKDL